MKIPTDLDLPLEWRVSPDLTDYDDAIAEMEARVHDIRNGHAGELIWLLQHPPVYTAGSSAKQHDLLTSKDALIRKVGRGGEWTYHGPGQRVIYILLDLNTRGQDLRQFVRQIENWAITSLAALKLKAHRRQGYPGVWLNPHSTKIPPDKIAAIGIRLTRWVSWHGMAINHSINLAAYDGIIPCGIHDGGVTNITAHQPEASMDDLDNALMQNFAASLPLK
jgi:lipoyl(octanoyl) transferase